MAALLFCFSAGAALADTTTVGVALNGTTGAHIEPGQAETIPFLPLPTFEIDHTHRQYELHLELMPPIGPVPLAPGTSFGGIGQDPRVSYVSAELRYRAFDDRFAFGVGETILNQRTLYPPSTIVAASRVVGMRLFGSEALYATASHRLDARIAVSPSLQGLQSNGLAEYGSLVDAELRWSIVERRFIVAYGLRYVNYAAAYRERNALADRNHLLMPFVALDWPLGQMHAPAPKGRIRLPASAAHARIGLRAGVSLLGTNGARSGTFSPDAPLNFSLVPAIALAASAGRFELRTEGIAPNSQADPFGAAGQRWS